MSTRAISTSRRSRTITARPTRCSRSAARTTCAFAQRSLGNIVERGSYSFVEARADWIQSAANDAGSVSAGLWRHLPAFSAASLALGLEERAELRFGDPMTGRALATDVSAVLGLYEAPLDLGVRVEQWYAGSSATRALLEIRVRLF